MRASIVIPTLDEEEALPRRLHALRDLPAEVIVSDGGSTDRTRELATDLGARLVVGPPGAPPSRGAQLNRGAAAARGEILLFLHADSRLPEGGIEAVSEAIDGGCVGGGFHVRYVEGGRLLTGFGNRWIRGRTSLTGWPLGDQAQFASRTAFEAVGGFPDWPILEDLELIRRLRRLGRTTVLDPVVVTSARRFESRGLARTVATNWLIWALYFAGVSPRSLARLYGRGRTAKE